MVYLNPTDQMSFNKEWKVSTAKKGYLKAGQSMEFGCTTKNILFDKSYLQDHANSYSTDFKAKVYMFVNHGTLGHETTDTKKVGIMPTFMDIRCKTVYKIHYDAGVRVQYTKVIDDLPITIGSAQLQTKPADAQNKGATAT